MASNQNNQGNQGNQNRGSQSKSSNRQSESASSSDGRGWHGDPEGHAEAGRQSHKNDDK